MDRYKDGNRRGLLKNLKPKLLRNLKPLVQRRDAGGKSHAWTLGMAYNRYGRHCLHVYRVHMKHKWTSCLDLYLSPKIPHYGFTDILTSYKNSSGPNIWSHCCTAKNFKCLRVGSGSQMQIPRSTLVQITKLCSIVCTVLNPHLELGWE